MKSYEGWSFRERSFAIALGLSILWHAFWFFSITIRLNPNKMLAKPRPKVVFLGSVLDDKMFRALIETKPEYSQTFYRRLSDFSSPVDIQTKTVERYSRGSVVSLPFEKKTWNAIRGLIGGIKTSPEHEFISRIKIGFTDQAVSIEGELKDRVILSRPEEPLPLAGMEPSFKNTEVVIELTVDASGSVSQARVMQSSGNTELDLLWVRYMKNWQFAPLNLEKQATDQKGMIKLHFSSMGQ